MDNYLDVRVKDMYWLKFLSGKRLLCDCGHSGEDCLAVCIAGRIARHCRHPCPPPDGMEERDGRAEPRSPQQGAGILTSGAELPIGQVLDQAAFVPSGRRTVQAISRAVSAGLQPTRCALPQLLPTDLSRGVTLFRCWPRFARAPGLRRSRAGGHRHLGAASGLGRARRSSRPDPGGHRRTGPGDRGRRGADA